MTKEGLFQVHKGMSLAFLSEHVDMINERMATEINERNESCQSPKEMLSPDKKKPIGTCLSLNRK